MIGNLQLPQPIVASLPRFSDLIKAIKRHRMVAGATALLLIVALVSGIILSVRSSASAAYVTAPVVQQDLTQNVTASGTVNPQNTINVGTQVSGTISAIYVDYNSRVKKGQLLARLDPTQLQAQMQQAQASLAQAEAQAAAAQETANGNSTAISVAQANSAAQAANAQAAQAAIETADANITKSQSAAQVANVTVQRDKALLAQGYIPRSQYDTDQSNAVAAESALKSAQAASIQARAQASAGASQAAASSDQAAQAASTAAGSSDTAQGAQAAVGAAQAQVAQAQYNLDRSVITSPTNGTVISRSVSVGQTVAASLQTPTLFTIAQDVRKMEVDIAVGEPDIGNVRSGDPVSFNVLAYPNETFRGVVSQVRENPTTVQNVVTYTVITLVNNPQNRLLPGMTANATIGVATAHNALVVPTQALAFRPSTARGNYRHGTSAAHVASGGAGSPWGQTAAGAGGSAAAGNTGVIFVQNGRQLAPVRVKIDLVSGTQAAVTPLCGTLAAGSNVVIGSSNSQSASSSTRTSSGPGGPGGMGGIGRALH